MNTLRSWFVQDSNLREASAALSQASADEAALLQQVLFEGAVFLKYGKSGPPRYDTGVLICR